MCRLCWEGAGPCVSRAELLLCSAALSSEHPGALGTQHLASNYLHEAQELNATQILQSPGRAGGELGLGDGCFSPWREGNWFCCPNSWGTGAQGCCAHPWPAQGCWEVLEAELRRQDEVELPAAWVGR